MPFSFWLFLCSWLLLPQTVQDSFRRATVHLLSPGWSLLNRTVHPATGQAQQEIDRLVLENQLLANHVAQLQEFIEQEYLLLQRALEEKEVTVAVVDERRQQLASFFQLEFMRLPARVICRPQELWHNVLWVDVGSEDNERLGYEVVVKNSPVVVGRAVVGIVDQVMAKRSRVRLITDVELNIAVRVKRGQWYLAKGEVNGMSPGWMRQRRPLLLGSGFNYDFADREGPSRDLRTGAPLEKGSMVPALPLVQLEDKIITTGLDGAFPYGLDIGVIKKIRPLKEGDYAFELEIEPAAHQLPSLNVVFILPPQKVDF